MKENRVMAELEVLGIGFAPWEWGLIIGDGLAVYHGLGEIVAERRP